MTAYARPRALGPGRRRGSCLSIPVLHGLAVKEVARIAGARRVQHSVERGIEHEVGRRAPDVEGQRKDRGGGRSSSGRPGGSGTPRSSRAVELAQGHSGVAPSEYTRVGAASSVGGAVGWGSAPPVGRIVRVATSAATSLADGGTFGPQLPENRRPGRPVSLLGASRYNPWVSRSVVQIHSPRLVVTTT